MNISNANAIADFDKGDRKQVSVSSLKCNNINVNVNGLELEVLPPFLGGEVAATVTDGESNTNSFANNESNDGSEINDFRFICINNNNNTVIQEEEPIPPTPPTPPTTASLTVKKQVFGCDNIITIPPVIQMNCRGFLNSTVTWIDCNNNSISNPIFCNSLPEKLFDIEVLDDQNNQIQQFKGSEQGTTIQNLDPGTYTVNEMKNFTDINDLGENALAEQDCLARGFTDGGSVKNTTIVIDYYPVCFEYIDEHGNDCSNITLAAGEERTCIVKNYSINATFFPVV
jgi:hypothetical protein